MRPGRAIKRRIIDCTAYTYEPSALAVRLSELAGVVDVHHIVSGNHTYRGKPQSVDAKADLIAAGYQSVDLSRVVFKEVDLPGGEPTWLAHGLTTTEKIQRDLTVVAAHEAVGDNSTLYLVSDCDEIPHPETLARAAERYHMTGPVVLKVDARCWYADWSASPNGNPWETPGHHRNQPILATARDIALLGGAQVARSARGYGRFRRWPVSRGPIGWHLSNLDGPAMVRDKFAKFSHNENDNDIDRDFGYLQGCIDQRLWPIHGWPLHVAPDLPESVRQKFPHLLGN